MRGANIITLPATILLAEQRFTDRHGIELGDIGANGEAVDRRGRND